MVNDDFDLDDLFRDEFKPDFSKFTKKHKVEAAPAIVEPIAQAEVEPVILSGEFTEAVEEFRPEILATDSEETLEEEIAEDIEELRDELEGEEVLVGNVVEVYEAPALEGTVIEEKKPETSDLMRAVEELQHLKDIDMQNDAQKNALRAKINETQKLLDVLRNDLIRTEELHRNHKAKMRQAEAKIEEEAHREAERLREEEIKKQRKSAMMGFHSYIQDLNPEWKDYAFDHQWEGASTLALHQGGLLADDMGLGKTLTAIMTADMLKAKFVLVIAPSDTVSNFTLEYAMWAKHRFVWTLAGNDKKSREVFMEYIIQPRVDKGEDITLLVNYEQLYNDLDYFDQLCEIPWEAVFVDEFHNAKNKGGLLFSRLKSLRARGVKQFFPMTGTPILNSPEDIWTALHIIDPDAFPNISSFRDSYCEYDYYKGRWVFRSGGEKSMLIRLGGRIVKRTMEEAGIILPKQYVHFVDIAFEDGMYLDQRRIMKQLAEHSQIILDSDRKVSIIEQIALITRQRQCAVWPAGIQIKDPMTGDIVFSVGEEVQESIKMDWVENKIKELRAGGKRVGVFSQFKTALAELERRLIEEGFRVVRYDGDTDRATKMKVKRDFDRKHVEKMDGEFEWDIVLCNYKTGGVGLNFTHITDLIMLDEEWNPGKNEQAYKRIRRIGQTEETHIWIPQLQGAIDAWLRALNVDKAQIIAGFDSEVDLQKEFNDFLSTMKQGV
jgi:SNF2 family DNA or RNA helicase